MPPLFVGRDREQLALREDLRAARDRTPQMTLVLGAAGIGKTTFGRAVVDAARDEGFAVGVGRAPEVGGAPPFWPWLAALEALADSAPELAPLLAGGAAALRPSAAEHDASAPLRFAHFDVVARALASAGRARPVLLWLDDVHAADEPTLVLARAVARQLDDTAVMLVLSARDAPADARTPELAARLAGLAAAGHVIVLGGLDRAAVATLATARMGSIAPSLLDALVATTGGHPFFVSELVAAAARGEDLAAMLLGPAPPPATVRELVRGTVERLPAPTRAVLHAAAVIGREAEAGLLERVVGLDAANVIAAIGEARRAGLALADDDPRRLVFVHALACNALATELAPTERVRLHARISDALEDAGDPRGERLATRAHHAVAAAALGPMRRERAVEVATATGDRAMQTLAYEEAARWFAHALAAAEDAAPPAAIADLLVRLGDARRASAAPALAAKCFERALELAEPLGAELYARAALGVAATREFSVRDLSKLALIERAAERLGDAATATAIRVNARRIRDLVMVPGSEVRRRALAAATIAAARRHGSPALVALALDAQLVATYAPDSLDRRGAVGDEILALARGCGDREHELAGLGWKLSNLIERGDLATARPLAIEHQRLAETLGAPGPRINAASRRAALAFAEGAWSEGVLHADVAFDLGERHGDDAAALLHAAQRALPALLRGDREELARVARVLDEHGGRVIHAAALRALAARVRLALGERERARSELGALAVDNWAAIPVDFVQLGAFALLADLVVELDERALAPSLLRKLAPYAARNATLGTAAVLGSLARHTAQLAALADDDAAAERHLRAALAHDRAMGAAPFVAWSAFALADVLARRGDPGVAALRIEAIELATRLELAPLLVAAETTVVPRAASVARLVRDGDHWSIERGGEVTRVKHQRGLELIAALVAQPARELHALDLVGGAGDERTAVREERGEALLDPRAIRELRSRVLDLEEDLAEAEARHDVARAERARDERDAIAQHLADTLGLGGKSRRAADATERARISATVAIRRALQMLVARAPDVGRHLSRSIRTGTSCAYRPNPTDRLWVCV